MLKLPKTYVHKKLGMSTVVAWELSQCASIETKAADATLDLSDRKTLPSHVIIEDGAQAGEVLLPDAKKHPSRVLTVVNRDDEDVDVGGVSCPAGEKTEIYSDGTAWVVL